MAGNAARSTPGRRPSGVDVALRAGVSQRTVSRVMANSSSVSSTLTARVLAAARELNYRPNAAARALNTGRTGRLGLVAVTTHLHGPAAQLVAVEEACRRSGHSLSLVSVPGHDAAELGEAIAALLDQGVDGLIVSDPLLCEVPSSVVVDIPAVWFGRLPLHEENFTSIGVDLVAASRELTCHLLKLGHETVWHIGGPPTWQTSQDREEGWRQALAEAGRSIPAPLASDWTAASGAAHARALVDAGATAVLAANDDTAIGVIHGLRALGLDVPADVSVAGIDDIPLAAFVDPPLTTVQQAFDVQGERAVALLVEALGAGTRTGGRVLLEAPVVHRASTAPPPGTLRSRSPSHTDRSTA